MIVGPPPSGDRVRSVPAPTMAAGYTTAAMEDQRGRWSRRLELRELLDSDFAGLLADSPKVPVHLHAKPRAAVLHPAFSSRSAISGDTPLCAFKRSDKALRVTPRCSAVSLTVRPRGLRQDSRITSPWAGLCLSWSSFRQSVVVVTRYPDHTGYKPRYCDPFRKSSGSVGVMLSDFCPRHFEQVNSRS